LEVVVVEHQALVLQELEEHLQHFMELHQQVAVEVKLQERQRQIIMLTHQEALEVVEQVILIHTQKDVVTLLQQIRLKEILEV
jgi:alkylhydroperoxidase/carboxymuconolactone decarboxylase family protein YurZ